MNMISNGSFLTETSASNKQSELVKKLTAAWEKKNSKTARAGGASLMALSLAACGGEDNTPFSQVDVDAAKAEGVASVDITSDNTDVMLSQADYDAAIETAKTSNDADIEAAAKTAALTSADGTIYSTVDAAYTAGSNLSNADAVTAALTSADGTVHASVDAAITSNDSTVEASATAAAETTLMAGTGFASVADLLAAYNDASGAPTPLSFTLTTGTDVVQGFTTGNDTVTGTAATLQSTDVLVDSNAADSDTVTINSTTADLTGVAPVMSGIENVVMNFTTFAEAKIDASNIAQGEVTMNQLQVGGSSNATVNDASGITVTGGTGITGTLTVNVDDLAETTTINAGNATTVTQTDDAGNAKAAAVVINGSASSTTLTGDTGDKGSVTLNGTATDVTLSATGATMNVVSAYEGTSTTGSDITVVGSSATTDVANVTLGGIVALTNTNVATMNLTAFADATVNITAASTTIDLGGENDITLSVLDTEVAGKTITSSGTGTYVVRITDEAADEDLSKFDNDIKVRIDDILTGKYIKIDSGATIDFRENTDVLDLVSSEVAGVTGDVINVIANNSAVAVTNGSTATDGFSTVNLSTETVASTVTMLAGSNALNLSGAKALTLAATSTASTVTNNGVAATYKIDGTDDVKIVGSATATDTIDVTIRAGVDLSDNTFSNVDVIKASAAASGGDTADNQDLIVNSSQVSGESIAVIGTLGSDSGTEEADDTLTVKANETSVNLGELSVDTSTITGVTIDLTSVASASVNITGSNAKDSLSNQGSGAITVDGKGGVDTLTTGSGNDTVTGGEGADVIRTMHGSDTVHLAESTAAADVVKVDWASGELNTVTGFGVGSAATADQIELVFADAGATLSNLDDNADVASAGDTIKFETVTAGTAFELATAADNTNVIVLDGDFADAATVASAISDGGATELKVGDTNALGAGDGYLIIYDNGADTHMAFAKTASSIAASASGTFTVTDFVVLEGVADATTLVAANLDLI